MSEISFAPLAEPLAFTRGDLVPPIWIPLRDENGAPLAVGAYNLTAEIIQFDGSRVAATGLTSANAVAFSLTPAQSAQAQEGSRWCLELATPDLSDVRTVALGPIELSLK